VSTVSTGAKLLRSALPDPERPGRVLGAMGRLEQAGSLDGVIETVRKAVRAVPLGRFRDGLHGRWLGHPVHPLMVQVPIGAWMSSAVLDWTPGGGRASGLLVAAGLAGAVPAAAAGLVDWAELEPSQARVGLAHLALTSTAVACYTASLGARLTRRPVRGRAYALAGLTAVAAAGAIGGHLAYRQAAGANHAEVVPRLVPPGWHAVGPLSELPEGRPVRRMVGEVALVVVRGADGEVRALADQCSHLGGPLSQGAVEDDCVRCPWHGSRFRLADGWNVAGPATAAQPAFEARVADGGQVQVRLRTSPAAGH
jgi:nitrite reductase/ring-hydroxylating ferredoxin subunit